MKQFFTIGCLILWTLQLQAQCEDVFTKNITHGDMHSLSTQTNILVSRVNFDYSIKFENSEEGITAVVTTTGHDYTLIKPLEKDDKLMFIAADGTKRPYNFIYDSEKTKVQNRAAYVNTVQLDMDALEWLSKNNIRQIRMVNMVEMKMYPYSLDDARHDQMQRTIKCFLQELDPTKVRDKEVTASMESIAANNTKKIDNKNTSAAATIARSSGSPCDQLTDEEEKALKRELALRKDELRNEIAEVREQNNTIKSRLAKDISLAKENAAKTQAAIAQQVLDARKRANIEIEEARAGVAKAIAEAQKTAASISEKAQLEALAVKTRSDQKIQEIQEEEAEKVANARKIASDKMVEAHQQFETAKEQYNVEIQTIKETVTEELQAIQKEVADKITAAKAKAREAQNLTAQDLLNILFCR